MAPGTTHVAFPMQGRGFSVRLGLDVNGLFNQFLPILKVLITLVYLGKDGWPDSVSEIINQVIFARGGIGVKLF